MKNEKVCRHTGRQKVRIDFLSACLFFEFLLRIVHIVLHECASAYEYEYINTQSSYNQRWKLMHTHIDMRWKMWKLMNKTISMMMEQNEIRALKIFS